MPSAIIGNPSASGPQILISGNPFSGWGPRIPMGYVKFKLDNNASGNVYIGFSGNMTMTSGGMFLSGAGANDGFALARGDIVDVPKSVVSPISGQFNVFAWADVACSGQARLYWSIF